MECCISHDDVLQSLEDQNCTSCPDSGYIGMQRFSKQAKTIGAIYGILEPFPLDCLSETPNVLIQNCASNLLFNTPKNTRPKNIVIGFKKDLNTNNASISSVFETPNMCKKDASFRRRLLSKAAINDNTGKIKTLDRNHVIFSGVSIVGDDFTCGRFDSPDTMKSETLATSTLKADELILLYRKKCLMFPKVKTSPPQDGKHEVVDIPSSGFRNRVSELCKTNVGMREHIIPCPLQSELLGTPCQSMVTQSTEGNFQTPVNNLDTSLADSRMLGTSPCVQISSLDTLSWEDSGFGTLEIEDMQNSYVGLDGSFQELLLHSASRGKETLNQTKSNGRSRLERRPSRLRDEEAISENESAPGHLKPQLFIQKACIREKRNELFLENTAPESSTCADQSVVRTLQVAHATCRLSAMLAGPKDLEELRKSSEDTRVVPLVEVIGRKMGQERLDILSEVKKRNLRHVFTTILNLLSCEDICRFGQVSDAWGEIVVQDKMASQRRRSFFRMQQMTLEGTTLHVPDAETRLNHPCRSPLMSVQAQAKTPQHHTPLAGNGSFTIVKHHVKPSASKREEFLQVAKTLFSDECLRPCPRCRHPARCHSVKREGVCSWGDCAFQFCTGCLRAYHGSRDCGGRSVRCYGRKDVLAGSTQSRRNLRRL
ncbi:F-box only protein 43 isoform X2 [Anguilla rostrata]|uniref:F-box only protein 43 isoform X2 n=1 Tax=Anguilla rostrata TaxID=7938 RepID=UPI0030CD9E3F